MKNRTIFWLYPLVSIGLSLILLICCKKDNDNIIDNAITVIDIDGNVYHTVTIGTQVWMVENLKTTKYNDSTSIPLVTDNTAWSNMTSPGYCWLNNDSLKYKNPYGALYNWYVVNSGKLSPKGWHVPTDDEWTTLTNFLGDESISGGKLKEKGMTHWAIPNVAADNSSGFTALPGGSRIGNGFFNAFSIAGYWWSSTEGISYDAWYRCLTNVTGSVSRYSFNKESGFSVRCVKD